MKKILGLILAVGLMLGALPARAEYPDKAITCIVPFAPGGAADITVRMVADYLSKEIGQPLVIVNKGGGSGIPGLNFGLKARPDGYTVLGGSIGNAFVATYFLGAPPMTWTRSPSWGRTCLTTACCSPGPTSPTRPGRSWWNMPGPIPVK